MNASFETRAAPSLEDFDSMVRRAFALLPEPFRALCGDIVFHVADFAEDALLAELGIEDPFDLTGLYEGADIAHRSIDNIAPEPNHVHLYRQPILAEWIDEGDIALGALIRHVLIHEIGHHFGLSDADMRRIEEETR